MFLTDNQYGPRKSRVLICNINTPLQSVQIKHTLYPETTTYIEENLNFYAQQTHYTGCTSLDMITKKKSLELLPMPCIMATLTLATWDH